MLLFILEASGQSEMGKTIFYLFFLRVMSLKVQLTADRSLHLPLLALEYDFIAVCNVICIFTVNPRSTDVLQLHRTIHVSSNGLNGPQCNVATAKSGQIINTLHR